MSLEIFLFSFGLGGGGAVAFGDIVVRNVHVCCKLLSILLPAQICKFHKEVEVANKPGTYVVGPINSTEHLENGFYSMKLKSRANNEKKDKFMQSYMDNQCLGAVTTPK